MMVVLIKVRIEIAVRYDEGRVKRWNSDFSVTPTCGAFRSVMMRLAGDFYCPNLAPTWGQLRGNLWLFRSNLHKS
ncbi:hypothetical protein S616_20105 [Salmonella enterica subsp. enterica]|nr:hypothetical protein [Salmonella enterica subsp. enterica]